MSPEIIIPNPASLSSKEIESIIIFLKEYCSVSSAVLVFNKISIVPVFFSSEWAYVEIRK